MKEGVFIIAEAGVNHNGSLELARKLIRAAANAGADAVKFQTFRSGLLATPGAPKAEYQEDGSGSRSSQLEMLSKLELNEDDHLNLIKHCRELGIRFMSTPFDHESIDMLNRLGLDVFKIGSGDMNNVPYLRHIAGLKKKIILSTGMSDLGEVGQSLKVLLDAGMKKSDIILLHTNTDYPTSFPDVNLLAMNTLKKEFGTEVGYSDHTRGIEAAVAAVALGASVIEKHFTLSREMEGPDHKASLEPEELGSMVKAIRNIEEALGDGIKKITASERKNIAAARKSIVALKDIKMGDVLNEENLTVKRPGNGKSPMLWDSIIGTRAEKDYKKDELI
jgi:N,N'-diacetyllegionaminate synthase